MARKTETAGLAPRQDGPAPRRTRWSHRTRWFRALIALAVCGTAVGGVAAYRSLSGGSGERPVTMDEASRLALSRLNVYQASPVAVTLTAAEGGGVVLRVSGVVDYRTHHGVGSYQTTGAGFTGSSGTSGATAAPQLDQGLIVWDSDGLGLAPALDGTPPWQQAEHIPRSGWSPRSYTTDPLDAGLQLLIGLGADRPDNPLLLAQSGARWLGRDRIDGRDYDEISGPRATGTTPGSGPDGGKSPLTYWVDGNGGLRRVTMRMPGLGTPTTLEFTGHDANAKLPEAPWDTGTG
ncbi:hypothetical protein ABH930_004919 [Kitasatospora sp. GAS204A]|uniref:hypothetical protein n=1 Tax=unclassified Kitasatospora TaxID=2633591 RepID=UPI00247474BE|nr:hypothetical protein [Kitasatospora sp. GAS204B]MDH6120928.1 hypothetical protein [Kitasatospora sp. GAS204B]